MHPKLVHLFLVPVQRTTRELYADNNLLHNNDSTEKMLLHASRGVPHLHAYFCSI